MKKMAALWAVSLSLLSLSFYYMGQAVNMRPPWLENLQDVTVFIVCWAGIEAARWILRESPASELVDSGSEAAQLWLWSGLGGSLYFTISLWLGKIVEPSLSIRQLDLLASHCATGALLWLVLGLYFFPSLWLTGRLHGRLARLCSWAYLGHGLGVLSFLYVFPGVFVGRARPWPEVLAIVYMMFKNFSEVFLYLAWAGLILAVLFNNGAKALLQRYLPE